MNDEDSGVMAGFVLACIILLSVFMGLVIPHTNNSWRQQIVDHGCAGWYLDSNSVKQWNWSKK